MFEQLPNAMDSSKNHMTGLLVREMKRSMDTHFENAIEDTAKEIKKYLVQKKATVSRHVCRTGMADSKTVPNAMY